jgi:hypothetical protein
MPSSSQVTQHKTVAVQSAERIEPLEPIKALWTADIAQAKAAQRAALLAEQKSEAAA